MKYYTINDLRKTKKDVLANTIDKNDARTWPVKGFEVWVFRKGRDPYLYVGVCSSMMCEEMESLDGCGWVPYIHSDEDDWEPEE